MRGFYAGVYDPCSKFPAKTKVISAALLISRSLNPPHLDFNQQTKLLVTEACCTIDYPIQSEWIFAGNPVIQVTQVERHNWTHH